MLRRIIPCSLGLALVVAIAPRAIGDDKDKAPPPPPPKVDPLQKYRDFLKPPTNVPEYWDAVQFEIELGSFELSARHLRGLMVFLDKNKPNDEALFALERQVGMAAILKLRNIRKWSDKPKEQTDAVADVENLIKLTTAAVRTKLTDPVRIKHYIALLYETPEEIQFALKELYESGSAVVPHMIAEIRQHPEKRQVIMSALRRMGPEVLPPLYAALESNDPVLKTDLIDLVRARAARDAMPYLWFMAASPAERDDVRAKALRTLALFTMPAERISSDKFVLEREIQKAIDQLPSSKSVLTKLADQYYRRQVYFIDPDHVTIWRWDGNNVVAGWPGAPTITASKAEEYFGVRYAGQALKLDPGYKPAQNLMVSLLLEKTYENGKLDQPLAKADPAVHAVLSTINPDVLISVLEQSLDEKRVSQILALTRTLGDLAEVRATRSTENAEPALMRALLFADRRVQMAAAEALLRVPGDRPALTGARIVEVLRRALAADNGGAPKVLIGYTGDEFANKVGEAVKAAGFDPIIVKSGRDLMKRVSAAADIEAVIFDFDLPEPGLPYLLGQLRGDVHANRIPLFITPPHQQEDRLVAELKDLEDKLKTAAPANKPALELRRSQLETELNRQTTVSMARLEGIAKVYHHVVPVETRQVLNVRDLVPLFQAKMDVAVSPALADPEKRDYAEKAVRYLARAAKGELPGLDATVAADTVLRALHAKKLSPEGQLAALEIAGRLPGKTPQTELMRVATDQDALRPPAVRLAAVFELIRHIQRNSLVLSDAEVLGLRDAHAQAKDATYKAALDQVLGVMRPSSRTSGEILRGYQPKTPGPAAPQK